MKASALILIVGSALVLQVAAQLDPVCDSCPSKNCTYDKRLSCSCTGLNRTIEIVDPGDREYFNVSLGFVVDNTGSMRTEIASVKSSIQAVVTATSGIFDKYVIGTYNDPYVANVFESTDASAINSFVSTINANAGGDCPEMAMHGIRDVADRLSPGSVIFLFTDASSKDLALEPDVKALLESKNIRLNVMATGNLCGMGAEFSRLTTATNGTIYRTPDKSDVDFVMNYIKNFAKYGIRFIRGMPTTLEDLKAIADGNCSCKTSIENLVCIEPPTKSCPCPEGFEHIVVKKKVCVPGPCKKHKYGSLGFVIDNTGSMAAEIFAVRAHIANIMANNTVFKDYVVATFGDPYKKNVIRSSDESVIQSFVNSISPSAGGDCPEFAMSGIEDAAKKARKNSVLVLFTDAAAKDASKLAAVKALLLAKNTKLFVIATGTFCGSGVYKGEFDDLAAASGGDVMTLTAKSSVSEVLDFLALAAAGKYSLRSFPRCLDDMRKMKPERCCKWVIHHKCKPIEPPCPLGYKRVTMRNKVCGSPNGCPRKRVGSLGFIIDDTGSMGAEIFAVRTHISAIMANNTVFKDYVVSRYGDPYVKNVIRSSDASAIQSFVNAIGPSGGGDCPEYAMSAIEDAAKEALENSVLILFTDAAAKDANMSADVAALLVSKKIKLYVIGTGQFCGPRVYKGEYDYLAAASGGSVMKLTAKTSVGEVLNFIGLAASGMTSFDSLPSTLEGLHGMPYHPVCDSCPSKNCTYDKRLSCSCTGLNRTIEIVDPGDREYFNVSLGFVVDNTGSMRTEIASVKSSIQAVVTATSGIFDKYVIGTYNDPYVANVFESTDASAINSFVSTINANAGGDCPEMAMHGIRDVADRLSPGSVIFLFTDASSKDLALEPDVKALLESKNIRLNVMATGNLCGMGAEFSRLTTATNGTIYRTPDKSDVDFVMNYIKNFAKYGIRFIRGMPTTLEDLKAIADGNCSCKTSIENLVCIEPPTKSCPCPEGFEHIVVKKKVCVPGPCKKHKYGSLGFVIDNTGSMAAEIFAVRAHIANIMANNTVFKDYVVATFGDPYKKNVIRSSDESVIQSFVNSISPSAGGDCPEFAMSGIEDAAKKARKNSVLVLFTDAAAKDASKLAAVKALLLAKNTKLFVIATGTFCGSGVYKGEFDDLAAASGGDVMTLTAKSSVSEVLDFLALAAAGKYSLRSFPRCLDDMRKMKPERCCKWVIHHKCKPIEPPCPLGYKRVTMRNKVCGSPNGCPRKRVGSLGFIIDDTGSMGAEIFAVRTHISAIMANNTVFKDYVVSRYGDPYVKNVIRSSDASAIQSFVNAIGPSGGGDCPEYAMSAIEDAAKEALENSVLILFTDAAAKDANMSADVAALLVSKKIKLYVIGTGQFCGPRVYKGEYDYLAAASGGSVMKLTAKTSVG
uniref:VWFA domain-containing protein n=1 Tax=Macrostomum lignano TaxID=282301 RepID=A0A1I8H6R5_9PLAT